MMPKPGRRSPRPTIGLLTYEADPNSSALWAGAADSALERGANLLCLPSQPLHSPIGFEAQANVLYDLVGPENVDGLVLWGSMLAQYCGPAEAAAFCERFRPLPIVSVGRPFEGVPCVLLDNYHSMRELVLHLIEVHGYRHIAFIRGPTTNPTAEERYRAYTDVLSEHGLPVDPTLVVPGDFTKLSGAAAVRQLLDRGKTDIEAIVAANDVTALGALDALQAGGRQVPRDMALVGFDDLEEVRYLNPPLTTVPVQFREMGWRAAEMVLALLAGEEVPQQVIVPSKVVVRQSCGCLDPTVVQAAAGPVAPAGETLETGFPAQRETILAAMAQELQCPVAGVEQILNAFVAEIWGDAPGLFLADLDEVLRGVIAREGDIVTWSSAISALRRHTLPWLLGDGERLRRAEDLLHQSQVMIGRSAERARVHRALAAQRRVEALHQVEGELTTAVEMAALLDAVARGLRRLGIPGCYLALYEDPASPTGQSRLILAFDDTGRTELNAAGQQFPTRQLVPEGVSPPDRLRGMVLQPLYFRESQLGFVLLEAGPQHSWMCEALRGTLSSALKTVLLIRERERAQESLERAYADIEEQVEERTAQLKQEVAERERAQEESARLQQEVIVAQQRAIQELSTPIIPVMDNIIVMPLIGSVDTFRAGYITRALLAGIREHRAKVVILDITGVPIVDTAVASHLNKTVHAARLKGARTIVTGISDEIAETIVDLGIDWSWIETLPDLRTGLAVALSSMGIKLSRS